MEKIDSKVYINYKEPVIILNKSKHIRSIKRNMPYNIRGMIEDIVILVDNNFSFFIVINLLIINLSKKMLVNVEFYKNGNKFDKKCTFNLL